ncbi:MAG TPA: kynureninase [Candidatus Dormibacteraeota bacterium]|nr:kynureninase [Candidatus Dormibacteraeota bacterium]
MNSREDFLRLDAEDPLASIREQFDLPPGLIYLDGNSLGAMPREARNRLAEATNQWARGLIASWNDAGWADAPMRVGAKIGRLIGAGPSEVVMGDTTSVNLYKALTAALTLRPGGAILTDELNFPTDLYIAEAVAKQAGVELRRVPRERLGDAVTKGVSVVTATHVDYRTGHMLGMKALTKAAHDAGALFVWDLCHSAGAVPLDLSDCDVDLAVGCTYKFLNGGPGAPAYLFAAARLHGDLINPIAGWFGHEKTFDFDSAYRAAPGARRFMTGTPVILAVAALEAAIDLWLTIDMNLVRSKSLALGDRLMGLVDLAPASPKQADMRGSQVSFRHPHAYGIVRAMAEVGVVGDHRPPDIARFGLTPLYTRYVDMWDAAEKLSEVLRRRTHLEPRFAVRVGVP